jgi:hypothetical protein
MLYVLLIPVLYASAIAHGYIKAYAPSNVLTRHIRTTRPRWWIAGALVALAGALAFGAHGLTIAVAAGAWGGLDLIAGILAWDAIKFACLAAGVALRCACSPICPTRPKAVWS